MLTTQPRNFSKRLERHGKSYENWRSIEWIWQRYMEIITLRSNMDCAKYAKVQNTNTHGYIIPA